MSDAPRPADSIEQRLALVARGVQRMADAFGDLDSRLAGLADADGLQSLADRIDEYRVRGRSEVGAVGDRLERVELEQQQLLDAVRGLALPEAAGDDAEPPPWVEQVLRRLDALEQRVVVAADRPVVDLAGPFDRLIQAVRALRDDIAVAIGELRTDTAVARTEQPSTARFDELQRLLDEVLSAVRSVHGEVVSASGQLRTDLVADLAAMRDRVHAPPGDDTRLAAIEHVLASLRDELAIDRLEASLRDMAEDTSGLRADVRRSFDRVLHEISTSEQSLKGEVRAIDSRLSGFGDDLRLVRGLRDGLEALASGVDAVRQLASRSATASQMTELAGELSTVLTEIETARSQVLAVDQQVGRMHAGAIDVGSTSEVGQKVAHLEQKVTDDIAHLGTRIEEIADRVMVALSDTDTGPGEDPVTARLRSLATSARQLSMGIAEDLRARRKRNRKPVRER